MPTELHSSSVLDHVLPGVQTDLHLARERCGGTTEQLLHHKPHGGAAERPRMFSARGLQCVGVCQRSSCWETALLSQSRGQGNPLTIWCWNQIWQHLMGIWRKKTSKELLVKCRFACTATSEREFLYHLSFCLHFSQFLIGRGSRVAFSSLFVLIPL